MSRTSGTENGRCVDCCKPNPFFSFGNFRFHIPRVSCIRLPLIPAVYSSLCVIENFFYPLILLLLHRVFIPDSVNAGRPAAHLPSCQKVFHRIVHRMFDRSSTTLCKHYRTRHSGTERTFRLSTILHLRVFHRNNSGQPLPGPRSFSAGPFSIHGPFRISFGISRAPGQGPGQPGVRKPRRIGTLPEWCFPFSGAPCDGDPGHPREADG